MRSLTIIVATTFALLMGFGVYWWLQRPKEHLQTGPKGGIVTVTPPKMRAPTASKVGETTEGWLYHYDKKTGKLVSRIKVDHSDPLPDGRAKVKEVKADFFMGNNQVMRLLGDHGTIVMQQELNRSKGGDPSGFNQSPSRGDLHEVTVKLYATQEILEKDKYADERDPGSQNPPHEDQVFHPTMILTMNNASFDNEALRIYTQSYTEGDKVIPHDQVLVKIRGDEYNFDGRGLEVRWNDRNHRLEFLKVYHGDRLEIKHPKKAFQQEEGVKPVAQADGAAGPQPAQETEQPWWNPLPGMVASTDKGAMPNPPPPQRPNANPATKEPKRIAPGSTKPTTRTDEPVYRAIFNDNVHIVQGSDMNAKADHLQVDFRQKDDHGGSTTKPAKGAATRDTHGGARPTPHPAMEAENAEPAHEKNEEVAAATHPATNPASKPSKRAATQSAEPPVVVTWTGPLTVSPLDEEAADRIAVGDSVLKLTGNPVVAEQAGSNISAATLMYWTADRTMQALSGQTATGAALPVILHDTQGAIVTTPQLDFSQYGHVAHLNGASTAHIPVKDEQATTQPATQPGMANAVKPAEELYAEWSEQCTLFFTENANHQNVIERADLRGNVYVKHPQLVLKSGVLVLGFEPAPPTTRPSKAATQPVASTTQPAKSTTQPDMLAMAEPTTAPTAKPTTRSARRESQMDLKQLDATDNVHCEITDSNKEMRTIDCKHLQLLTARTGDSRSYPRNIIADGNVHAVDPKQDMHCGYMSIVLAPTTRPSKGSSTKPSGGNQMAQTDLQSLVAHDKVQVISKDNSSATAEQLLIETVSPGKQSLKLLGSPAIASQNGTVISGPIIQFSPENQGLNVLGAGSLDTVQQDDTTSAARPMRVVWQTGLSGDGVSNQVDVLGNVVSTTTDADGSVDVAKAERIRLNLADNPKATTKPSTKPSTQATATTGPAVATTAPTTGPTTRLAKKSTSQPSNELFGRKVVKNIVLQNNAQVNSTLLDDTGKLMRRVQMDSTTIDYDVLTKRLLVPVPGTLLYEDHRPPTTKPSSRPATDSNESSDMRGATAFTWEKKLLYDEPGHRATLEGAARIVHTDDGPEGKHFEMTGESFVADLEPSDPNKTPTTKPSGATSDHMKVKHIHGEGTVVFRTPGLWFEAETIDYDPITHLMVAHGLPRKPARLLEDKDGPQQGLETGRFDELVYNQLTGQFTTSGMAFTARRGTATTTPTPKFGPR